MSKGDRSDSERFPKASASGCLLPRGHMDPDMSDFWWERGGAPLGGHLRVEWAEDSLQPPPYG